MDYPDVKKGNDPAAVNLCWAAAIANVFEWTEWIDKIGCANTAEDIFQLYIDEGFTSTNYIIDGVIWLLNKYSPSTNVYDVIQARSCYNIMHMYEVFVYSGAAIIGMVNEQGSGHAVTAYTMNYKNLYGDPRCASSIGYVDSDTEVSELFYMTDIQYNTSKHKLTIKDRNLQQWDIDSWYSIPYKSN